MAWNCFNCFKAYPLNPVCICSLFREGWLRAKRGQREGKERARIGKPHLTLSLPSLCSLIAHFEKSLYREWIELKLITNYRGLNWKKKTRFIERFKKWKQIIISIYKTYRWHCSDFLIYGFKGSDFERFESLKDLKVEKNIVSYDSEFVLFKE